MQENTDQKKLIQCVSYISIHLVSLKFVDGAIHQNHEKCKRNKFSVKLFDNRIIFSAHYLKARANVELLFFPWFAW